MTLTNKETGTDSPSNRSQGLGLMDAVLGFWMSCGEQEPSADAPRGSGCQKRSVRVMVRIENYLSASSLRDPGVFERHRGPQVFDHAPKDGSSGLHPVQEDVS